MMLKRPIQVNSEVLSCHVKEFAVIIKLGTSKKLLECNIRVAFLKNHCHKDDEGIAQKSGEIC